ncbi:unnamed protein product [Sphagnum jensenii]
MKVPALLQLEHMLKVNPLPSTENGVDEWIVGDMSGSDARVSSPCCHSLANTSVVSVVSPSNQQVDRLCSNRDSFEHNTIKPSDGEVVNVAEKPLEKENLPTDNRLEKDSLRTQDSSSEESNLTVVAEQSKTLQIAEITVSSQKTETGYCLATGLPACEQLVIEEQRAVEKEIGKIEITEAGKDLHDLVTIDEEIPAVHSSERDEDCLMAMDEDLQLSTVVDNGRDAVVKPSLPSFETPSAADISPKRPVLLTDECPWNSSPNLETRRDSPDVSQPQLMHPSEQGELGVDILQESKLRVDLEELDSRDMKLEIRHETGEPFLGGQVMDSQPSLLGKVEHIEPNADLKERLDVCQTVALEDLQNFADLLILKN